MSTQAYDPAIHPYQSSGAIEPAVRPSLRAAKEKAEERRRLAIKSVYLPNLSEELGFDVNVSYRRMTLQEVVASGRIDDYVREYADVLMEAMLNASVKARGAFTKDTPDNSPAKAEVVTQEAVQKTQEEFGGTGFLDRQKAARNATIMCACLDPMIVDSYDSPDYTDPDNMLVLTDIPEADLVILYGAISRNEQEAVESDLKSVPAEPVASEAEAGSAADDGEAVVHAPETGEGAEHEGSDPGGD